MSGQVPIVLAMVVLAVMCHANYAGTAHEVRRALASLSNTTCVIVSQRVSAVRGADLVLVLDHGRMVGLGTHDELLRDCGLYREICDSQLARGEVA